MRALCFAPPSRLLAAFGLALSLLLGSCQARVSTATGSQYADGVVIRLLLPAETDPAIDGWPDPYVVMHDPGATAQEQLFVLLPGSFGKPENLQLLLKTGALRGYHVIGLSYPNDWTVNSLCDPSNDPACFGAVRDEIVNGVDRSPLVSISPPNAIVHRLQAAVRYLATTYPAEGWGQFLDPQDQLIWSRVTVGGHSQGGGHAAFLAKQQWVARVCMFSSPLDVLGQGATSVVATWLGQPGLTPATSHVGLVAEQEGGYAQILLSWQALGVPGATSPVKVDGLPSLDPDARSLATNVTPAQPGAFHGSTANDRSTPLTAEGVPVLKPVWDFMCFPSASPQQALFLPALMVAR